MSAITPSIACPIVAKRLTGSDKTGRRASNPEPPKSERPRMIRRHFLAAASLVQAQRRPAPDRGPALPDELVKEFLGAAHSKLDRTKELLAREPGLLNATWDWGGGDFETALGGASHMGARDIALFLLERGARLDLFAAAMLGYLDVVKAALQAQPGLMSSPGPHGIPLLRHAVVGGEPAKAVVEYLESRKAG